MQLNPNYVRCHLWRAHFPGAAGRYQEVPAESFHIIELDPLDLIIHSL